MIISAFLMFNSNNRIKLHSRWEHPPNKYLVTVGNDAVFQDTTYIPAAKLILWEVTLIVVGMIFAK